MGTTISVPKEEYDQLIEKASLFDQFIGTEELTKEELKQIKEAMKGPFLTKSELLKRHSDLN